MAEPDPDSNKSWKFIMGWMGRISAIVGLCGSFAAGWTWWINHQRTQKERLAQMAVAKAQIDQGQYGPSIETYQAILKQNPLDQAVQNDQLQATLLWVENFSVLLPEGQDASSIAGPEIDRIFAILEAGLTRSTGSRAADVRAHLGWAHWLNRHIAGREFGTAAEDNMRSALTIDPSNAYANAMLGNWLLQNGGSFSEATEHLRTAVAANRALPFVRRLEIGGLLSYDEPGARRELMQAINSMRTHGEILESAGRHRILVFCCDVILDDHAQLIESLSALSPPDAWLSYVWLTSTESGEQMNSSRLADREYVQAMLVAISGDHTKALNQLRALEQKLHQQPSNALGVVVAAEAQRLSSGKL